MIKALFFINFLCIFFISLLIYSRNKKYFLLSPLFAFNSIWTLVFFLYIFKQQFLSLNTFGLIMFFNLMINISFLIFDQSINNENFKKANNIISYDIIRWEKITLLILQSISLVAAILYIKTILIENMAGLAFFSAFSDSNSFDIESIRIFMAIGDFHVPVWMKILNQFNYFNIINPILFYLVIKESDNAKNRIYFIISITIAILYSVLLMQRSFILLYLTILCYTMLMVNQNFKKIFKNVIIVAGIFLLLSMLIANLRLNKNSDVIDVSLFDYYYNYIVGGLSGLEAFLNGYKFGTADVLEHNQINFISNVGFSVADMQYGMNTFSSIAAIISKIMMIDLYIPQHYEYIYYPITSNIYPIMRPIYQDFSFWGMIFFPIFYSLVNIYLYKKNYGSNKITSLFIVSYLNYVMIRSFAGFVFEMKEFLGALLIAIFIDHFFTKSGKMSKKMSSLNDLQVS